ncbi:hypothetical protein AAKU55_005243 [Oxalobacteraceae bacterium GrIS 1.11]
MTPGPAAPHHQPAPPSAAEDAKKKLAEQKEVAGRHKNDGQKDHKGAR